MRKFSGKTVEILLLVFCIIFTLGGLASVYFFFIKYKDSIKRISVYERKVKVLSNDLKDLDRFLDWYSKDKQRFEKILFKDKDIPLFLEGLSALSKKFNIKIVDIKTKSAQRVKIEEKISRRGRRKESKEKETQPTLLFTPLSLRIKGKFANLVDFLLALERYRQLLSLTEVKIKTKNYPTLECSFDLNLYSLKVLKPKVR